MSRFNDSTGREWSFTLNVNIVKRVRGTLDFNLADANIGEVAERLLGDVVLLCDVLFVILQPEAKERNVSDIEFGQAMAGDVIEKGALALLDAIANFTPNPRDRARVKQIVEGVLAAGDRHHDALDRKVTAAIEKFQTSIDSVLNSPPSPESIPAP